MRLPCVDRQTIIGNTIIAIICIWGLLACDGVMDMAFFGFALLWLAGRWHYDVTGRKTPVTVTAAYFGEFGALLSVVLGPFLM